MGTMEATDYKEAYRQLRMDTIPYRSPVRDMTKYIDKMTMIGRKYGQLERTIRDNLSTGEATVLLQESFEIEFGALEYMSSVLMDCLRKNRYLQEAATDGNGELKALLGDFRLVRLAVKAKAMGAKAEMQEFNSRITRVYESA